MSSVIVRGLSKSFGGLRAATEVSFTARPGEILALVGPNGAGKSTVLNMVAGMFRPTRGTVEAFGSDVTGWSLERRVRAGVSILRQHSSPLPNYTVAQNLELAELTGARRRSSSGAARFDEIVRLLELQDSLSRRPSSLTHGDLRRLEFARVLILEPTVVLLDEPFAGLAESEVELFSRVIRSLAAEGKTVILVDHDVNAVKALATSVVLMELGKVVDAGATDQVFGGETIRDIYLGTPIEPRERSSSSVAEPPLLDVESLSVSYGVHAAVSDVSLQIAAGQICSVLGLNGAGKSSLLNAIAGFNRYQGRVSMAGCSLDELASWDRVIAGIGYVPEERALFGSMSVEQHLRLASPSGAEKEALARAYGLFPRLGERRAQRAGTMSGGEQQMLAVARALVRAPECLLIDEPTLGLAPTVVSDIAVALTTLATEGTAVVLSEQNVRFAGALADTYLVMRDGRFVLSGLGADMLKDGDLIAELVGD